MTQMTFGSMQASGAEGSIANFCDEVTTTKQASYDIEFGRKLCYDDVNSTKVSTIGINKIVLTSSGSLDASDIFGFNLHVKNLATGNESVIPITSGVFATSDAVTMGAAVTQLETITGITDADTSYLANVLTVVCDPGYVMKITDVVYGGGSAVTLVSKVNSDTRVRSGFARHTNKMPFADASGNQVSRYFAADPMVNDTLSADMTVLSPTGFDNNDNLYYCGYGTNQGRVVNAVGDDIITAPVNDIVHKSSAGTNSKGVLTLKTATA